MFELTGSTELFPLIAHGEIEIEKRRVALARCLDFSPDALYHHLNSSMSGINSRNLLDFVLKKGHAEDLSEFDMIIKHY